MKKHFDIERFVMGGVLIMTFVSGFFIERPAIAFLYGIAFSIGMLFVAAASLDDY